jgi:ABC-type multidrug transport system ATPase subunit
VRAISQNGFPLQLKVEKLSKNYPGGVQALREVQISLQPGILGLLGPNGAGKSTLMRILATVAKPTSGRVFWNDMDIARDPEVLRNVIGYLPQDFGVYPNLSAIEFLEYLAAVKGISAGVARKRIGELLELVDLGEAAKRPLGGYSGGMRQRVGIAQALLNDPQLLIVDEPTAGLDPEERVRFRNLLSELSGERIVILSTHIVSDVEAVATSIAILAYGQLLTHDSPEGLLAGVGGKVWELVVSSAELPSLRQKHLISNTAHRSDGVHARVVAVSAPAAGARPLEPSLEDAYLAALAVERADHSAGALA